MPRLSLNYCNETHHFDFCFECWETLSVEDIQELIPINQIQATEIIQKHMPTGVEHPPYNDINTKCVLCKLPLTFEGG